MFMLSNLKEINVAVGQRQCPKGGSIGVQNRGKSWNFNKTNMTNEAVSKGEKLKKVVYLRRLLYFCSSNFMRLFGLHFVRSTNVGCGLNLLEKHFTDSLLSKNLPIRRQHTKRKVKCSRGMRELDWVLVCKVTANTIDSGKQYKFHAFLIV